MRTSFMKSARNVHEVSFKSKGVTYHVTLWWTSNPNGFCHYAEN